jgi:hypothetical protein
MDFPSSKRQDKRDSKKKQSAHSIYTAKHTRIAAAVAATSAEKTAPKQKQKSKSQTGSAKK